MSALMGLWMALSSHLPTVTDEVRFFAWTMGVDPDLAQAVTIVESGERDGLVSKTGDFGRGQVNCHTWLRKLGIESCAQLLNVHINAWAQARVMAAFKRRFAARDGWACRCRESKGTPHWWIAHYNSGNKLTPRGMAYQMVARWHVKRLVRERAEKGGKRS